MARDLICFSHLRWDFVFQRPNHLMVRAARDRRVFYIEEPVEDPAGTAPVFERRTVHGVELVVPHLPPGLGRAARFEALRRLLDGLIIEERIHRPVLWYYDPMPIAWTDDVQAAAVVYDSMDFLGGFRGASPDLAAREAALLARADVVFAGGAQLHLRQRDRHPDVHCFPSAVDVAHFRSARAMRPGDGPADQAAIARPRIGYYGVIDERLDHDLLAAVAAARRDWQFVLVGPLAKVSDAELAHGPNVHYLARKAYEELPAYLGGWDVAMMPFAHNDATRFISPTKTPEYLAGGRPVASTSIHDVVEPYGRLGLVQIGDGPERFIDAIEAAMRTDRRELARRADGLLATMSWDRTWAEMRRLVDTAAARRWRPALPTARQPRDGARTARASLPVGAAD